MCCENNQPKRVYIDKLTKKFLFKYSMACVCKIIFGIATAIFFTLSVFGVPFVVASIGMILEAISGECYDVYIDCYNTEIEFRNEELENRARSFVSGVILLGILIITGILIVILYNFAYINAISKNQH